MRVWKWILVLAIIVVAFFAVFKGLVGKEHSNIRWVEVTRGTIERQAVGMGMIGPEFEVDMNDERFMVLRDVSKIYSMGGHRGAGPARMSSFQWFLGELTLQNARLVPNVFLSRLA